MEDMASNVNTSSVLTRSIISTIRLRERIEKRRRKEVSNKNGKEREQERIKKEKRGKNKKD